jgi:peptidoglycan/xylan/chitin deacetylase (PgdA/CDA1 family)
MRRRTFVQTAALSCLAAGFGGCPRAKKTHLITLSFDDGFKRSFHGIADIHETYGLHACLNVIASGQLTTFRPPDEYHSVLRGDFVDWNSLKKRGHEIMPHSWDHANLTQMPLEQAKADIVRCLDYFSEHLDGFDPKKAVYNFAYNASAPELERFALTRVRAVRTQGDTAVNPLPSPNRPRRLGCWSFGPANADKWVEEQVDTFLTGPGGWLILNLHGLDEEGWGPVSSGYLEALLGRLVKVSFLAVQPAGEALAGS